MDIGTKEEFKTKLAKLIEVFSNNEEYYKSKKYKEDHVRQDFINPFFKALGWDMDNERGVAPQYREVIYEDRIEIEGKPKAPDYAFRLGSERKFFVEAKASSVKVYSEVDPAFQLRRYAWSGKLPVSILTDFEEFSVYDTTIEPKHSDKASVARVKYIHYKDYLKEADYIWETFSRDGVWKGSFDKFAVKDKKGSQLVDKSFLREIEQWRELVAKDIASNNDISIYDLNYVVQKFIDRIIFLRIAEDRGIENYENLKSTIASKDTYSELLKIFRRAEDKYNSSLFDLKKDHVSEKIKVSDKALDRILNNLYYPKSPYEFSVIGVDILGSVYEQFLGKVIRLTRGGNAVVEEKPEVKKAGGVYYTPKYIVDYIVKNTVGELVKDKTPRQVANLNIVDPACGSGSFLIGAYNFLLDWHLKYYTENDPDKHVKAKRLFMDSQGNYLLSTQEKRDILVNIIHGVDIDPQAVEVTKLSLALKMLEDENSETIGAQFVLFADRILPDLSSNIKCGNSLVGNDYYSDKQISLLDDKELRKVNAFDWEKEFPMVFRYGGFDAVIGNPPYVNSREMEDSLKKYFEKYQTASDQYDLYTLFVEKGILLLKDLGYLSFITPDKFLITKYGEVLKKFVYENTKIIDVADYTDQDVFDGVGVYPVVFVLQKSEGDGQCTFEELLYGNSIKILDQIDSFESIDFDVWRPLATSKSIVEVSDGDIIVSNRQVSKFKVVNPIKGFVKDGRVKDSQPNKIIMKKLCYELEAVIDKEGFQTINTVYCLTSEHNYLYYILGILNSRLMTFYARNKYKSTALRGGYIELRVFQVKSLTIKIPTEDELRKMSSLVENICNLSEGDSRYGLIMNKIDSLVYEIYGLVSKDIKLVEETVF